MFRSLPRHSQRRRLRMFAPAAAALALALPAAAQCGDDAYEENDSCAMTSALPVGVTNGLIVYHQNTDPDFWTLVVPANTALNIDALFTHALGDIDIALRDGTCSVTHDAGGSASDNENVSFNNQSGVPETVVLEVYVWNQSPINCNTYSLDVSLTPSVVCGVDDIYEDNDFCGLHTAVALPFNAPQLYVEQGDDDFYEFTLPNNEQLDVDVLFQHAIADVDVFVYDVNVSCAGNSVFLATSQSATNNESVSYVNLTGATQTIAVKIEVWAGSQGFCNRYDLTLTKGPITTPCISLPDDGFEENDDCMTAALLVNDTYTGLKITLNDNDFYRFQVDAGDTLSIDALFLHNDADIELFLYDLAVNSCGGQNSSYTARSVSGTNDEHIGWTNNTGGVADMVLEVDIYNFSAGTCAIYDLVLDGTNMSAPIGAPFCVANANSTGAPSTISANHAPVVNDPTFALTAEPLPSNSFGFFLMSATTNSGMVVSAGRLCLAPTVYRYQLTVLNTGGGHSATMVMPWGQLPAPIAAGSTWHFQYWHRDAQGGATVSNFSEGRSLTFS